MPFQENVLNFVQFAVIDHKDGVLLVFFLFIVTFYSCFLLVFYFDFLY